MFFGCLFVVLILYVYTVINEIHIKKKVFQMALLKK